MMGSSAHPLMFWGPTMTSSKLRRWSGSMEDFRREGIRHFDLSSGEGKFEKWGMKLSCQVRRSFISLFVHLKGN
jgi:hypothetical protein